MSQHLCADAVWHSRSGIPLNKALLYGKLLLVHGIKLLLGLLQACFYFFFRLVDGFVLVFQ